MRGWYHSSYISYAICLFGRLSRKVCEKQSTDTWLIIWYRTLIAGVQPNASHPCVRCLVEKKKIYKIGGRNDFRTRRKYRRIEDYDTRKRRAEAAKRIYQGRMRTTYSSVKALLSAQSLVPVKVSGVYADDVSLLESSSECFWCLRWAPFRHVYCWYSSWSPYRRLQSHIQVSGWYTGLLFRRSCCYN